MRRLLYDSMTLFARKFERTRRSFARCESLLFVMKILEKHLFSVLPVPDRLKLRIATRGNRYTQCHQESCSTLRFCTQKCVCVHYFRLRYETLAKAVTSAPVREGRTAHTDRANNTFQIAESNPLSKSS